MEWRIVLAVGNMIEILGLGRGFWTGAMVDRVGMRVVRNHFSPTDAMEETWAMI